ncbi:class I SAM-dependent methyltransferase [Desulfovibrio piger]|uniref:class I SAM-dependent methyltransferase n=1 Tax=Desulfovibrio piger TaxID=901 RepID=UPI0026ECB428|nr:class I SAM-dependent methyltransferase [Desulfovibrio piger]
MIDMIPRTRCVLTGKEDLEPLYTFHDFPVFMGCVEDGSAAGDTRADMRWAISRETGCIQLDALLPLDILQFHPQKVLEIGGGHGILPTLYAKQGSACDWTVVEPNPTPVDGCPAQFIRGFFDEDLYRTLPPVDAIVHSHVLEHIYEPDAFLGTVSAALREGDRLLFSVPDLENLLKKKTTNCINFEHTVFLTEPFIDYLLRKNSLSLERKEHFDNGHSIFYAARKMGRDAAETPAPPQLHAAYKALFLDYITFHEELVAQLNSAMRQADAPVFLFGAHIFSLYLINFGLETEKIQGILDNDPHKQGKRLYGTDLHVSSPRILKDIPQANVILRAGIYNDEIKRDILENINPAVVFWE